MADKIDSLFRDVQPLAKVTEGKPAPHENLADILEIVAVASGIRPAHLQGQRQHDDQRLAEIEGIAERHGLKTIRTKTLKPFFHRTPRFDQGIIDFENADNQKKQDDGPDVAGVYLDENVAAAIPGVVAGHGGISTVLGYPECCVIFESERKIALGEAYAQGIIDTYHAASPDEVVRLWKGNVQVQVAVDPDHDIHDTNRSLRRFPYLQLVHVARARPTTTPLPLGSITECVILPSAWRHRLVAASGRRGIWLSTRVGQSQWVETIPVDAAVEGITSTAVFGMILFLTGRMTFN